MKKLCYFLVFRRLKNSAEIHWKHPTGGLVMKPKRFAYGMPVADIDLALDIITQRYHCDPKEEVLVAEVFGKQEMRMAAKLHEQWEAEMHQFLELMNAGE